MTSPTIIVAAMEKLMSDRIFKEREQAMEATYFRQQDAKLLEALQADANLDDIAVAMAKKLTVDNAELLLRVRELGVTADTAAAFLLAPMVQVAWADGRVSRRAREAILNAAHARGIAPESPAQEQLLKWLEKRPDDRLYAIALEVIGYGLAVLSPREKEERQNRIVDTCREVALASASSLARMLGLTSGISRAEALTLTAIAKSLRTSPTPFKSGRKTPPSATAGSGLQHA